MNLFLRVTRWTALALSLAGAVLATFASGPSGWPFLVSPQGSPNLEIALVAPDTQTGLPPLTARHVLVFDGEGYFSKIAISGISSSLLQSGRDEWEWERFGGGVFVFKNGKSVNDPAWTMTQQEVDGRRQTVIARSDGSEVHEFSGCYLQRFSRRENRFSLKYQDDRLVELSQVAPLQRVLVQLAYDGLSTTVKAGGRTLRIEYNARGQVVRCADVKTGVSLLECGYSPEKLLQRIAVPGRVADFAWASPQWKEYFQPATPPPPVIRNDGRFSYRTQIAGTEMTTQFITADETIAGSWRINRRNGEIKFTLDKGHL